MGQMLMDFRFVLEIPLQAYPELENQVIHSPSHHPSQFLATHTPSHPGDHVCWSMKVCGQESARVATMIEEAYVSGTVAGTLPLHSLFIY